MVGVLRVFAVALISALTTGAASAQLAAAQSLVRFLDVAPGSAILAQVACPAGQVAVGGGAFVRSDALVLTVSGPMLGETPFIGLSSGTYGPATGWVGGAFNAGTSAASLYVVVHCAPVTGVAIVVGGGQLAANSAGVAVTGACPAGSVLVAGGGGVALPQMALVENAPAMGSSGASILSTDDGTYADARAWRAGAINTASVAAGLRAAAICVPATQVGALSIVIASARANGLDSSGGDWCPAGRIALNAGGAIQTSTATGGFLGFLPAYRGLPNLPYERDVGNYEPASGFFAVWTSYTSSPKGGKSALFCVAPAGTAVATVGVVEYYNATFEHYFVTPLAVEIEALDSGRFVGWVRTGESFRSYSASTLSTVPVCRYFRTDVTSHFYSASGPECNAVRGFAGWTFETERLFSGYLPANTTTGACETGQIPLYRLWNKKVNHRYTTSRTIRDQMIARGYIPEGYGPDGVAMCVLPPA